MLQNRMWVRTSVPASSLQFLQLKSYIGFSCLSTSQTPWFDLHNNVWLKIKFINLLIIKLSPCFYSGPKLYPPHRVLKCPHPTFFPQVKEPWLEDQTVARSLLSLNSTQMHTQSTVPQERFESVIPTFERGALDHATARIDIIRQSETRWYVLDC